MHLPLHCYVNSLVSVDGAETTLKLQICEKKQIDYAIGKIVLRPEGQSGQLEATELPGGAIFLTIKNSKDGILNIKQDGIKVERISNQNTKIVLSPMTRVRNIHSFTIYLINKDLTGFQVPY